MADKANLKFIQNAFKNFNKNVNTIQKHNDRTADALEKMGYDQSEYRKKRGKGKK